MLKQTNQLTGLIFMNLKENTLSPVSNICLSYNFFNFILSTTVGLQVLMQGSQIHEANCKKFVI